MDTRSLTRTLKSRLPDTVTERLKTVALQTAHATAGARPPPSVIVIGAQRSGTTTLFRLLAEHPHLARPTYWKGTGYFDDDYARGPRWYRSHFPLTPPGGRPTFECSGYYLFHPLAAQRIEADLPDVQVVVMLRDPVERASSAYRHELARGFETRSFDQALETEDERTAGESERLVAEPGYRSFGHRHHSYFHRGAYAPQVGRYVEALGSDRVHTMDAGYFFDDPVGQFVDLQETLGLPVWTPPRVDRWNARPGSPMSAALRRRLLRRYEPYDDDLTDLLGAAPSWRAGIAS